ncbi:MAG: DEAD/DEAH box helicase, partial [Acidobacteriota bacterium]
MQLLWVSEEGKPQSIKVNVNDGSYELVNAPDTVQLSSAPMLVIDGQASELTDLYRLFHPDQPFNAGIAEDSEELAKIAVDIWNTAVSVGLSNLKQAVMTLSSTDTASRFLNHVIDSLVLDRILVSDEVREKRAARDVDFDINAIIHDFKPGGLLESRLKDYQHREQQVKMAIEVCKAIEENDFLMAEAGTGVGKSLAYLVPAIYWAAAESEKVLIATRTRALQRQIAEKDMPMLEEA